MRTASKSPLRSVTPHRNDEISHLRSENDRLKAEMSVLKEICASERVRTQELTEKLEQTSEFKFSIESQLHQELKRHVETNHRLRDELRKKEIANAEMAVRLSEYEQQAVKMKDEYRVMGEMMSVRTEKMIRMEKEWKVMERQLEERQRLLDAVAAEKAALMRETESAHLECHELIQVKESLNRQYQTKTEQLTTALEQYRQDRNLLVWESVSRTRVLAAARVHTILLQVFRTQKRIGYHSIHLTADRNFSLKTSTLVLFRSLGKTLKGRKKLGLDAMKCEKREGNSEFGGRFYVNRMRKSVISRWRVLSNRRRKCRIVLRLFLQAAHKACLHSKKGLLRAGLSAIQSSARITKNRLKSLSSILFKEQKNRKKIAFGRFQTQIANFAKKRRVYLNRVFFALNLNRYLQKETGNLANQIQTMETEIVRQSYNLLSVKSLENCIKTAKLRRIALAWRCIKSNAVNDRERQKRVNTVDILTGKMKEKELIWRQEKVFKAWKESIYESKIEGLCREIETEKPLREYYQTTSSEFGRDVKRGKGVQGVHVLTAVLASRVNTVQREVWTHIRRKVVLSKPAIRKIVLHFRHFVSHSFTTWRKKVYELNLSDLCQDQVKGKIYTDNLISHLEELETVIEDQSEEKMELKRRIFGRLCGKMETNWRRNWMGLWKWIAKRNNSYRISAKRINSVIKTAFLRFALRKITQNVSIKNKIHEKIAQKARKTRILVLKKWQYLLKLKQLILKLIGKYCNRKEIHIKELAISHWHRKISLFSTKSTENIVKNTQEKCLFLRNELEIAENNLIETREIAEIYEKTIEKMTQRRLILFASISLKNGLKSAFQRWIFTINSQKRREKCANRMLKISKKLTKSEIWRKWRNFSKEMQEMEIREMYISQVTVNKRLSEKEMQRDEDVLEVQRELNERKWREKRKNKQLKAVVRGNGQKKREKVGKLAFEGWKKVVFGRKKGLKMLFNRINSKLSRQFLQKLRLNSRLYLHISHLTHHLHHHNLLSLHHSLHTWQFQLSKATHGLMSRQLLHGEGHISLLQSNLSSVKKKLRWKTVVSAKEKRSWTVFKAWNNVILKEKSVKMVGKMGEIRRKKEKLIKAMQKLRIFRNNRIKYRQIREKSQLFFAKRSQFLVFSAIKRIANLHKKIAKATKMMEICIFTKFKRFSLNKLVRFYCVVKIHQRWKLRSGQKSFKNCLIGATKRSLFNYFSKWERISQQKLTKNRLFRLIISKLNTRFFRKTVEKWKIATLQGRISTFSVSRSNLSQELKQIQGKAVILQSLLLKEGLNSLEIRRFIESQEREITGKAAIRTNTLSDLPISELKNVKRKLKLAALKVKNWLHNSEISHSFSVWKNRFSWLKSVPKDEIIRAISVFNPSKGENLLQFARKKKRITSKMKEIGVTVLKMWLERGLYRVWTHTKNYVLQDKIGDMVKLMEDKEDDLQSIRQSKSLLEREKVELMQALQQNKQEGVQSEAVSKVLQRLTTEREQLADELAHRSFTIRKLLEENAGLSVKLANAQMEAEKLILLSQESLLPEHATFSSPLRFDDLKSNNY